MTSGLNLRSSIWRMTVDQDDAVGGALITGTIVYQNVPTRLTRMRSEQLLLQQGLETPMLFKGIVIPGTMTIYERDELEVTFPGTHPFYGKRYRVVEAHLDNAVPQNPHSYIELVLVRDERAHGVQ